MTSRTLVALTALVCLAAVVAEASAAAEAQQTIEIRGHTLKLVVSGDPHGQPVIVSSGDGGWIHLAPHVADVLAASGFYVIGFDSRAYLETFTSGQSRLGEDDVRRDFEVLAAYAAQTAHSRPILVGVSEGAGLSVLAATGARLQHAVAGVIVLGLPNINELAWRWRDAVIYLTHSVPNEPTFQVDHLIGRLGPLPLAAVHSTNDEFAPVAEIERIVGLANEPKKLWTIVASDHRFSDNIGELDRRLLEAVAWTTAHSPR